VTRINPAQPGLYWETRCALEELPRNLVAGDPGVRSLFHLASLQDKDKTLDVKQSQYRAESGRTQLSKVIARLRTEGSKELETALTAGPSSKSVLVRDLVGYYQIRARYWIASWEFVAQRKRRKAKLHAWGKRQAWMDGVVAQVGKIFKGGEGEQPPVLVLGNASEKRGGFGRVKGGGVKGPVKELRKRFARRFAVIVVSEYRTSANCIYCGAQLQHPVRHHDVFKKGREGPLYRKDSVMHGVSFCRHEDNDSHHHMQGRDRMAAYSIGARFVAQQRGLDLGPWKPGAPTSADEAGGWAPSTVLLDVLRARGVDLLPARA
jgi:hypothetical protein